MGRYKRRCKKNKRSQALKKFWAFNRLHKEISKKWAEAAGREDLLELPVEQLNKYRLCQQHFEGEFVVASGSRTHLLPTAIPTIFPKEEIDHPDIPDSEYKDPLLENQEVNFGVKIKQEKEVEVDESQMQTSSTLLQQIKQEELYIKDEPLQYDRPDFVYGLKQPDQEVDFSTQLKPVTAASVNKSEAKQMFLLSLLPELEKMNDQQMKMFKQRVFQAIDEIMGPGASTSSIKD